MSKPAVLYISYDGMLEPLGQSQVIAYLERLADTARFHIVSFEKPADLADTTRRLATARRLERAGIAWHPLKYHKRPTLPATLYDIALGTAVGLWLMLRYRLRIVHARSYLPALIGLWIKRLTGARLVFDMRGFWADERRDSGAWNASGTLYRSVKRIERSLLRAADHIVTLTCAAKAELESFPISRPVPISVIPTCADLDKFALRTRRPDVFTLGYLGTVGMNRLFPEVLACFRILREARPDARLLVVNRGEHEQVRAAVHEAGIPDDAIELVTAHHDEVPALIGRMSAGTALNRPSYAEIARAPTKLAEYLACGVPCLCNAGIGDLEAILQGETAGVILREFTEAERRRAIARLLELDADPLTTETCRKLARDRFSLEAGTRIYRAIYQDLIARTGNC
jgi:glycosyltransferase involved in cell wall biosynthesis